MNRIHSRHTLASLTCCLALAATTPAFAQEQASPRAPGFADVVKETLGDFKRLPSTETVTWLGLGAAAASMGRGADRPMSDALSSSRGLDGVFAPGETIGGARFQLAGAVATYAIGRAAGQGRVAQVGADLIRANIVAQALTGGIKLSVRRGRPDGTEFSFPSGHTSVSFAAATVLQKHFGWRGGIPAYAAATYIATSRIQERRHFLSDVAFGAIVGIVAGRTVTVGRGDYTFAVEPMAAPGGVGVAFTRR
jgi:hypothetical protein